MQYLERDLGHRTGGEVVEFTLSGSAANVRLLDSLNFYNYKHAQSYRFHGGLAKGSPVHVRIPSSDHWHAVVDMQGLIGRVQCSVRVLA